MAEAVGAFYAVETAVEGAAAAGIAIAQATMPLKASFKKISTTKVLPRSSHSLSIIKGRGFIFGGEEKSGEPVDNAVHVFTLPSSGVEEADYKEVPAQPVNVDAKVPEPRLGHTAAVVADRIYVFGGMGGGNQNPIDEHGRVWVFETSSNSWSHLDPAPGSAYPEARFHHASTSTEHPMPSTNKDHTANPVGFPDQEAHGTIFIHAGCSASGRLSDLWAFDVASRMWSKLPDAPEPTRSGTCLTFTRNRLYRYGGFDGTNELGGEMDCLELVRSTFDDQSGKGNLGVSPRTGTWETISFPSDKQSPGHRSVAGLEAITTGQGRNFLLLFMGERNPDSSGNDAAGQFWGDVWSYQLHPDGMTAASFKDAARQVVGARTGESEWAQVNIPESTMAEGQLDLPGERGWFASGRGRDMDGGYVVIWGGRNEKSERQGDGWILDIEI
ncbi:hypothetical protein MMC09_003310 [Bachmanniomyces sp. S44760]|nr:hypothetical protein [Bachmanniomyces sp. S44760]